MTPEDKLFHASVAAMQVVPIPNFYPVEDLGETVQKSVGEFALRCVLVGRALLAELDKEGGE